jgi:transcriptional regulator with XRE-family HTH domain
VAEAQKPINRFGEALLSARNNKGMSQAALAKEVHAASHTTVSEWETGKRVPDRDVVVLLEHVLEVKKHALLRAWTAQTGDRSRTNAARRRAALLLTPAVGVGLLIALFLAQGDDDKIPTAAQAPTEASRGPATTPAPTTTVRTVVTTVRPSADVYVNEGAPTSNFSLASPEFSSELFSRGIPGYVSYLRFVLPAAPPGKPLARARIVIRTTPGLRAGSDDPHYVYVAADEWDESKVTWNSRPPLTATTVGAIHAPATNTTYEVDLDVSALQARLGGPVTLAVTNTNREARDNLIFWGNKADFEDYRVRLTLTFGSP